MIQTPFNYTGSKFKLLEQLLPEFDYTKHNFIDGFCGGGSVYTNVLDKYKIVYGNDVTGNIGKKQISEAGYNSFWKQKDELELYTTIKNIDSKGGSFAISGVLEHDGKTCWILDKLKNEGYKTIFFNHDYNKVARNKVDKGTKEVLIKNY